MSVHSKMQLGCMQCVHAGLLHLLAHMLLNACRHKLVGQAGMSGLSVEQRKRCVDQVAVSQCGELCDAALPTVAAA